MQYFSIKFLRHTCALLIGFIVISHRLGSNCILLPVVDLKYRCKKTRMRVM